MFDQKLLSRRHFLQLTSALGVSTFLAACIAPSAQSSLTAPTVIATTPVATASPQAIAELLGDDMPGSPNHAKGFTTVLPDLPGGVPAQEQITISCTRRVDSQTKFAEGDSLESNPWSRMIYKLFGVQFAVSWTWANDDEAKSKYNLTLASGDLPDYLETVPNTIFVEMVKAGALEDLTDLWPTYASDRWQSIFAEYGEMPWIWSKIDGHIWGFPLVVDLAHDDTILWYRADWLEKLSLNPPATLDELHDVALAIVQAGLGKGAPGTTVGLAANKEYAHTWFGSLDPVWGAYGYIPDQWRKDGNGLSFNGIRPELKEPLALLNQWYEEGIFRKDFFSFETSESMQDVAASNCGLHISPAFSINRDAIKNDPETRWAFTDIPTGPNGHKGKHTESPFADAPFAFRKGVQHVDKVFEMANWMIELTEDYWRRFHGWEGYTYRWDGDSVSATGMDWNPWAVGPIGTRAGGMADPHNVGNRILYRRQEWSDIAVEDRDAMQNNLLADPTGLQMLGQDARLFALNHNVDGMTTELQRLPTPTMIERGDDLQKLVDTTMISIIIGEKPLEAFDEMAMQWQQLGGDKITEEVNEWWRQKNS